MTCNQVWRFYVQELSEHNKYSTTVLVLASQFLWIRNEQDIHSPGLAPTRKKTQALKFKNYASHKGLLGPITIVLPKNNVSIVFHLKIIDGGMW